MTYTPAQARDAAEKIWKYRRSNRNPIALEWDTHTAPDGTPMVSARINSPYAASALLLFVREGTLLLDGSGACQQPTLDDSVPGRTALVWRTGGVWVELWHPVAMAPPVPVVQTVPDPVPAVVKEGPAGRLPFRRFRRSNIGHAS